MIIIEKEENDSAASLCCGLFDPLTPPFFLCLLRLLCLLSPRLLCLLSPDTLIGVGFFTDAYDIFSISIAATMIGYVYHAGGEKPTYANTANQDLGIKVAHSVGTFFGQLLFGWLADHVGRKRMYGIELMIIMIGTLGQAIAGHAPGVSIYAVLIMWRFIMVSPSWSSDKHELRVIGYGYRR